MSTFCSISRSDVTRRLHDIIQYGLRFVGSKPAVFGIATEPRQLPLGVLPCMLLDPTDSLRLIVLPFEIVKYFLVPNRAQGVEMPVGVQRCRLLEQSRFDHPVHTFVDDPVQFPAIHCETDFDYRKGRRT